MTTTVTTPARPTAPSPHRILSEGDLALILDQVVTSDLEQGLTACFAVADAFGLCPPADVPAAELVRTHSMTSLHDLTLPESQWRRIAIAVHDRAEEIEDGSGAAVLHDWAVFGPGVHPRPLV